MESKFQTICEEEIMNIDGGVAWVPIIIIGGGVISLCVGFYNGYCEATRE